MNDAPDTMTARLRADIAALLAAYVSHAGVSEYRFADEAFGERTYFYGLLRGRQRGINVRTYDVTVARFSQVWPADLPWPEGILRIDPASVPDFPVFPALTKPSAADAA